MDLSLFLAKAFGIYFIVMSLAVWLNKDRYIAIVNNLMQNDSLLMILGFNILILGILLILSHNIWNPTWQLVVTLLAWVVFIKGMLTLVFPAFSKKMTLAFLRAKINVYVSILLNLLIGLYLCYVGFF